jgi:leader peptidase (prepilin peptidase)/N-methyltransferase
MNLSLEVYLSGILILILLFSAIKDWKENIIPNVYLVRSASIRVLLLLHEISIYGTEAINKLVLKVMIGFFIIIIGILIRKLTKDGIGMGDIKLCALMFLYLESSVWVSSLFVSLILVTIHLFIVIVGKKERVRVPFAPSLFLGTLAAILFL